MNLTDDFSHLIGTIRTDSRGWRYRVESVKYRQGSRFASDSLTFEGRCIDDNPAGTAPNATTYGAYCYEIFYTTEALEDALRTKEEETTEIPVTQDSKHFVKLTRSQFKALQRLTAGPADLQTERTRSLVKNLELWQLDRSGRYHVMLTTQDLGSVRYIFGVYALRNGTACLYRFMREYGLLVPKTDA
jgi:hypothetical protein